MFSETMLANIIRFYGHAMQGFMGSYLERGILAFAEMQAQFADASVQFTPDFWRQSTPCPRKCPCPCICCCKCRSTWHARPGMYSARSAANRLPPLPPERDFHHTSQAPDRSNCGTGALFL